MPASGDLQRALEAIDLDAVSARTRAVLEEPLYWFPVRHHSPAVAKHVAAAIEARRPEVIFLEAPAEAQSLAPFVVDKKTKPPVALYVSYRDDDDVLGLAGIASPSKDVPARFASYYPLLAYSPEYVTLCEAAARGIDVVFMDLPRHALLRPHREDGEEGEDEAEAEVEPPLGRSWEVIAEGSSFYRRLAEAAGYRSWDEAWDAMFEVTRRLDDHEAFRAELALFCAAVRATSAPAALEQDGTLARERFMRRTIEHELAARKLPRDRAMVVCGGFHLFLDRSDETPPPVPPKGTVYATVTPYSYFRISDLAGYGAGNRAPAYYERVWTALSQAARAADGDAATVATAHHVVAVLARGRKSGEALSSADAIAVTQHARLLAKLRGHAAPLLDDLRDALVTCCCKGRPNEEGAHLLRAMADVEIGAAIGRVTPAIGQLPLHADFYAQLDDLGLAEALAKEKRIDLRLDLREPLDARRSAFLHRLLHLGVPFAELRDRGAVGATLFRETWRLLWTPKTEPELIEKNLYGDTLERAATALLQELLAKEEGNAGTLSARLLASVAMDLPSLHTELHDACARSIEGDAAFTSLAAAVGNLRLLEQLAAHRDVRPDLVRRLVARAFDRAAFTVPAVSSVPEDERDAVVRGLSILAEAVLADEQGLFDRDLLSAGLRSAANDSTVPYLRGVFDGLLAETRVESPEFLGARLSAFALERPDVLVTAGAYLDGVLTVSQTSVMLGAATLVVALDELYRAASWDAFVLMLPELRHAFERLHARHRDAVAGRVATHYGLADEKQLARLSTSVGAAVALADIDRRAAEIMEAWGL